MQEYRVWFLMVLLTAFLLPLFGNTLSAQVSGDDVVARRASLEDELVEIEKEIAVQQTLLGEKRSERVSLERDVAILDAEIGRARLSIRARTIVIAQLEREIVAKGATIIGLDEKLGRERESLAQLIRKTNELDHFSLIEIMLSNKNLSDFLGDLDDFDTINVALQESFIEIVDTKNTTAAQKESLEGKRTEEVELRFIQELEKREIEAREAEKQQILKITKGIESAYQSIIKNKEKTAAQIRTELFTLRGTAAIPFEQALNYANEAFAKTGVRPAFILGVIAYESRLGEFIGQCLLTNSPSKGDGKGINTGRIFKQVMKPDRDVDAFIDILSRLGLDPSGMVVSCPPSYGYGGAMGPAQFIPSTWVLYEARIAKATGQNPPNPWDPRTAFMASAILLSDNGADGGTYATEHLAARRYFAGWANADKSTHAHYYGNEVMGLAAKYQGLIDILASS